MPKVQQGCDPRKPGVVWILSDVAGPILRSSLLSRHFPKSHTRDGRAVCVVLPRHTGLNCASVWGLRRPSAVSGDTLQAAAGSLSLELLMSSLESVTLFLKFFSTVNNSLLRPTPPPCSSCRAHARPSVTPSRRFTDVTTSDDFYTMGTYWGPACRPAVGPHGLNSGALASVEPLSLQKFSVNK